ncbi:MAG: ABC-F family ATP-binding cassette domain-containing protein [Alphaproteobacteria bacterium]|nr:ABC-F family ATP-binding cassette domain-containing protein [Alphaproteobacteria bacterium]
MPPPLLLSVKDAMVRYSEEPLFENLDFNIHEGVRIALVGKNGAGKSTLMNIITGAQELDDGERWEEAGTTIGYLRQDIKPKEGETVFDYIFEEIQAEERELHGYKVDIVAEALHLDVNAKMTRLSGGQLRRAGLARALVEEPDILLLDEPTNHLDLEAIEWLEEYLNSYRGTLLVVSHDRTFLANITNQVFWLDRGELKVSPRGFKYFDEWSEMLLEQEARELKNRKAIVAQEVEWASRGVKARRKRNVRRLEQVREMRDKLKADESSHRRATQKIEFEPMKELDASSKVVGEFYNVSKTFEEDGKKINILDKFNLRIKRGDRIGILGKNGSGKTTFLKLLLGELEPDQGNVKTRKELEFSYFDQKRSDLEPTDTLKKTLCPGGGDYIDVMGKSRHVCGYLKDFMFDPSRSQDKVSQLSGGQKNRLMLAKILANPKTCLILDEPTNDLDMDTLDMLEDILMQYKGTLLVVSHDRDFLDQTVTKILAFEGDAKVETVIGGYSDYLEKKTGVSNTPDKKQPETTDKKASKSEEKTQKSSSKPQKLTYKLQHEFKQLPGKISKAEKLVSDLTEKLSDSDFYLKDPDGFHEVTKELQETKAKLERYETRWLEIAEMKEEIEK